ncbi:MAG: hypothetical protein ACOC8P_01425 [Dichotomicrobium sp.]
MFQATFLFVPPGGGEVDYKLTFYLPQLPHPGDYVSIGRADAEEPGFETFIVRRTWWEMAFPESGVTVKPETEKVGRTTNILVECEFAYGQFSSESHKRACEDHDRKAATSGQPAVKTFDDSCY